MNTTSGFVCAALPSVAQHVNSIMKYQPDYISNDSVNHFMLSECNKYLSSVGVALNKGGIDEKLFARYQKMFDGFLSTDYLKGVELILDSAGFQFQCGLIPKKDSYKFVDMYHNFLTKNVDNYKNAFLFDPVPGSVSAIISSYAEMVELNVMSYSKASALPAEVRKKLMYIHHFRTPKINKMYKSLLFDYRFADNFDNFATGGLVAFSKGGQTAPPCILYTIPLVAIIKYAKERGLKKFRFHVLGSTEWKDIVMHNFAMHHIKHVHDIDVEITYDSSTIFKTLMLGRYLYVPIVEDKSIWKMSLRSDLIHMQWKDKGRVDDYYYSLINELADAYGFKRVSREKDPIYEDGRITRIMYTYGIFIILRLFNLCDKWSKEWVRDLYPLYTSGQTIEFDNEIEKIMFKLNDGKFSKTITTRTSSFYNSLKMLEDLDIDYCDYIVDKFLSSDEPMELQGLTECTF